MVNYCHGLQAWLAVSGYLAASACFQFYRHIVPVDNSAYTGQVFAVGQAKQTGTDLITWLWFIESVLLLPDIVQGLRFIARASRPGFELHLGHHIDALVHSYFKT